MHRVLFTLLLVLMPSQLGYHFWPEWTLVLGRRVDYLSPTLYLTDILVVLTIVLWLIESKISIKGLVSSIKEKKKRRYQRIFSIIRNTRYLILVFLFVVINILVSVSKPVAILKWVKVVEFLALAWYIVKTKPRFENIVTPLAVALLFSSILVFAQFNLQHSVGGLMWWFGERTFNVDTPGIARIHLCQLSIVNCQLLLRPYATFPHPNVLGGFLAVVLPLFLIQLHRKRSFFLIITIVLGLTALFLTYSRSAWAVGAAGLSIMYLVLRRKQRNARPSFVLILIPVILFIVFIAVNIDLESESFVVRQQLNVAALTMVRQSPLLGTGLGNFFVNLPAVLPSRTIDFLQPVHNIYLLFLAESGIIGFAFFLWLLGKTFSGTWYVASRKAVTQRYALRFALFALLLLGLVDHYPVTIQQGQLLFTLFIGLNLAGHAGMNNTS